MVKTNFEKAKAELEKKIAIMDEIQSAIESTKNSLEYYTQKTIEIGEEQRVDKDGNLKFNEDGTPSMRTLYESVPMTKAEIEEAIASNSYTGKHIIGLRGLIEYLEKFTV